MSTILWQLISVTWGTFLATGGAGSDPLSAAVRKMTGMSRRMLEEMRRKMRLAMVTPNERFPEQVGKRDRSYGMGSVFPKKAGFFEILSIGRNYATGRPEIKPNLDETSPVG